MSEPNTPSAAATPGAQVITAETLRAQIAQRGAGHKELTEREHTAAVEALQGIRALAAQIGAAWQSDLSALEAVHEQRR